MFRSNRRLKNCGRIMLIVILMNLLIPFPVFAELPITPSPILSEEGTRLYSDSDLDLLIDEISAAAYEAIEKAAAESAKAATLAGLEREAVILREVTLLQADAQFWRLQAETNLLAISAAKKAGRKNAVIVGAVCLIGGLIFGVGVQNLLPCRF